MNGEARLLRLVQEGTWRPVGADAHERADVRIVAATWKDLQGEVREGRFREDLYHRLAVVELELPALRDRGEDVRLLAEHFLHTESKRLGRTPPKLSHRLFNHLDKLSWPGNVRELRHAMAYLAVVPQGARVDIDDLPPRLRRLTAAPVLGPDVRTDLPYLEARRVWLDAFQARYVQALLDEHGGNVSAAARAAGLDRRTIQRIRGRLLDADGQDDD